MPSNKSTHMLKIIKGSSLRDFEFGWIVYFRF
jgi:hypothetical protein